MRLGKFWAPPEDSSLAVSPENCRQPQVVLGPGGVPHQGVQDASDVVSEAGKAGGFSQLGEQRGEFRLEDEDVFEGGAIKIGSQVRPHQGQQRVQGEFGRGWVPRSARRCFFLRRVLKSCACVYCARARRQVSHL